MNTTTGTISGTATTANSYSVTVTMKDKSNNTDVETFGWTVYPVPSINALATQNSGVNRTVNLNLTYGCARTPCTFSGAGLPAGLTLNTSTGVISGTTTTTGTSSVQLGITDAAGRSGTPVTFIWNVWAGPTIVTPPAQVSTQGTAANLSVSYGCSYAPCTFTASGLPAGLTINSSTGLISGTPTASTTTTTSVIVTVTDPSGNAASTSSFSWTVYALPTITSPGTQKSGVNQPISPLTVSSYCGRTPCTFSASGLPTGLSINAGTGTISGTPTTAGSFSVTVTITDGGGKTATTPAFSWTVYAKPTITTPGTLNLNPNTAMSSVSLGYTCPMTGCIFTSSGLPTGVSVNSSGVISGTPTVTGTFSATITIIDASGNSATTSAFPIYVYPAVVLTIPNQFSRTSAAVTWSVGMFTTGGAAPYTYSLAAGTLPGTLTLNSNGTFGGNTGTTATTKTGIQIKVTDTLGNTATSASFSWNIHSSTSGALALSLTNQASTVGTFDSYDIWGSGAVTGGVTAYTFSITSGTLPAGLSLNPATGVISGTPTTANNGQGVSLTVQVRDAAGNTASDTFRWKVNS